MPEDAVVAPVVKRHKKNRIRVSVSMLRTFKTCPRKAFFTYVKSLEKPTANVARDIGTVFHKAAEAWYRMGCPADVAPISQQLWLHYEEQRKRGFLRPADEEKLLEAYTVADGMFQGYAANYGQKDRAAWEILAVEYRFAYRLNGYLLDGVADLVVREIVTGKVFVVEHKTKSASGIGALLGSADFSDQATQYPLALRKRFGEITGTLYNVVIRPSIRQKQSETREQYVARCIQLYREIPKEMFVRHLVRFNEKQVRMVKREMIQAADSMVAARDHRAWYRNSEACYQFGEPCAFLELCVNAPVGLKPVLLSQFRKRESKSFRREKE